MTVISGLSYFIWIASFLEYGVRFWPELRCTFSSAPGYLWARLFICLVRAGGERLQGRINVLPVFLVDRLHGRDSSPERRKFWRRVFHLEPPFVGHCWAFRLSPNLLTPSIISVDSK